MEWGRWPHRRGEKEGILYGEGRREEFGYDGVEMGGGGAGDGTGRSEEIDIPIHARYFCRYNFSYQVL